MRTFFGGLPAVALLALQLCPIVLADLTKSSEPAPVLEKREPLDLSTDPYYKPQASLGKRAGSGRDLVKKQCVDPNMVVFSLDDGPYLWHGESAKFFESNGLKASWFINGDNWDCIYKYYPELKKNFKKGHFLGQHSWAHPDMTTLSWEQAHDELWRVEKAFIQMFGARPLFMRFPYGSYNDMLLDVALVRGYKAVVDWNLSPGDAEGVIRTVKQQLRYINQNLVTHRTIPGPLSLLHETHQSTVERTIPKALPRVQKAGYKHVTVPECLGFSGNWKTWYEWGDKKEKPNPTWKCERNPYTAGQK